MDQFTTCVMVTTEPAQLLGAEKLGESAGRSCQPGKWCGGDTELFPRRKYVLSIGDRGLDLDSGGILLLPWMTPLAL
jgi:hypothetical protein